MINPWRHSCRDTFRHWSTSSMFFPFKLPALRELLLCAAGTPGMVLKRQCGESRWVMQSDQSGECSLLCVFGLFVCFAFFHSFSPVYLSMANGVVSSEACSSLCNIALLSIWYAHHLAGCKCWSVQCQDWNGGLSMRVQISEAHPYSHSSGCFIKKLFSCEGVLSPWWRKGSFGIEVWEKKEA